MIYGYDPPADTHHLSSSTVCVCLSVCACMCSDLFAIRHVAGQQQDLGGRERGGDRQAVLLLSDLLSVSVHPLLQRGRWS